MSFPQVTLMESRWKGEKANVLDKEDIRDDTEISDEEVCMEIMKSSWYPQGLEGGTMETMNKSFAEKVRMSRISSEEE